MTFDTVGEYADVVRAAIHFSKQGKELSEELQKELLLLTDQLIETAKKCDAELAPLLKQPAMKQYNNDLMKAIHRSDHALGKPDLSTSHSHANWLSWQDSIAPPPMSTRLKMPLQLIRNWDKVTIESTKTSPQFRINCKGIFSLVDIGGGGDRVLP